MINNPFFSVVMPVYNKERHVSRAIDSVFSQTYRNFELIVVCDPSTDGSTGIVEDYGVEGIKILYRNEPGPGGYAARNLGIKNAQSDWIAFLDADDEWFPDHLEKLSQLSNIYPQAEILGAGWITIGADFREKPFINKFHAFHKKNSYFFDSKEYLYLEISEQRPFYTSTVAIKRNVLLECGAFPEGRANRGGDVDTWLRAISRSDALAVSSNVGARYFRDSDNMVTRTAIDDAAIIRSTVNTLIREEGDADTVRLLKLFSNKYTISAWLGNEFVGIGKNFFLPKNLYFKVEPVRAIAYSFLSLLPGGFIRALRRVKNKVFR